MKYGLTQKFIKMVRDELTSGRITYNEAMQVLEYELNANLMSYIQDDVNEN